MTPFPGAAGEGTGDERHCAFDPIFDVCFSGSYLHLRMTDAAFQQCINPACKTQYAVEQTKVACEKCGSLLDILYDWEPHNRPEIVQTF